MLHYQIKLLFIFLWILRQVAYNKIVNEGEIKVFTVATEENDGYRRFIQSANNNNIKVETLGMGTVWRGGDMSGTGGGYKINLLRSAVEKYKDNKNMIVIFTDSYDVVFTSGILEIVKKFKNTDARVLFSAEHFCWPNDKLRDQYPIVNTNAARFLNSGMFIGYAHELYEIIKKPVLDTADDQLFYTEVFLNDKLRTKLRIQLDSTSEIFQNLHGAQSDVRLDVSLISGEGVLQNIHYQTTPNIIHGNGPSKLTLNSISNYLGTFKDKHCLVCEQNKIILDKSELPTLSVAVFAEKPAPFFEEYLNKILALQYPKKNINLFIHCNTDYHDKLLEKFIEKNGKEYKSVRSILSYDKIEERMARRLAIQQAQLRKSEYLFVVDNEVHIDYPEILMDLISFNRSFIAPVITRENDLWSNFWGALSENQYYARSHDYVDIVKGNLRGMWNVPFVSSCYLIRKNIFDSMKFENTKYDPDMSLCEELRYQGIFMYIVNLQTYGHLINTDEFNINTAIPDFYTLLSNPSDWENRYIDEKYWFQFIEGAKFEQPCPDVYWFRIVTERFCDDLITIMEHYGKWSGGKNEDTRLEGGYEAVPTRDIHMNQVGLEPLWLRFLKDYVRPLQEAAFTGYYHNPPKSLMNFVVRYKPDEQASLRPHHDSSTYTINIALNTVGVDYIGGGCRFIRYNCSVTDTKKGWLLLHPGKLTHYHEGLKVINGTRYIMISFVNP